MTKLAKVLLPHSFASASTTVLLENSETCLDIKTKIVQKHNPTNSRREAYVLVYEGEIINDNVVLSTRFTSNVTLVLQLGKNDNKTVISLRYGDQIMLAETKEGTPDKQYIGAVTTGQGVYACTPSVQLMRNTSIYRPSLFTVVAPSTKHHHHRQNSASSGVSSDGEGVVHYGDELVLVDRAGLVWNNNSTPTSVDFRARGAQGEIFVRFDCFNSISSDNRRSSGSSSANQEKSSIVHLGDKVTLTVTQSNRLTKKFNTILTKLPLKSMPDSGHSLSCDGGEDIVFEVLPCVRVDTLRVEMPRQSDPSKMKVVSTHIHVGWGESVALGVLPWDALLVLELSNGSKVSIPKTAMNLKGQGQFDAFGGESGGKQLSVTVAWDGTNTHLLVSRTQLCQFFLQLVVLVLCVSLCIANSYFSCIWHYKHVLCVTIAIFVTHSASRSRITSELYGRRSLTQNEWTVVPLTLCFSAAPATTEIPLRFVRAENGDISKASLRYQATLKWRRDKALDTILQRPHPKFDIIKAHTSHYFHGRDKLGFPIFIESLGHLNWLALQSAGVTVEDLLYDARYHLEYMFSVLSPDENARSVTILDMDGVTMAEAKGEKMEFLKRLMAENSGHYPERTRMMFIVNCPFWFNAIWKAVSSFLPERTLDKINISAKKGYEAKLLEIVDAKSLPSEYGGCCTFSECKAEGCSVSSPESVALAQFVRLGGLSNAKGDKKENK